MDNVNIIINGRAISAEPRLHSYANLVHLGDGQPGVLYTMTYDKGPRNRPEGSLTKDSFIRVVEGMIINFHDTSGA